MNELIDKLPRNTFIKVLKDPSVKKKGTDVLYEVGDTSKSIVGNNLEDTINKFLGIYASASIKKTNRRKNIEKEKCCVECGSTEDLTVDHIIPLHFFRIFNRSQDGEFVGNYATLCQECNIKKAYYIDISRPVIFYTIIKYLNYLRREEKKSKKRNE